jgi:hypothetical protein
MDIWKKDISDREKKKKKCLVRRQRLCGNWPWRWGTEISGREEVVICCLSETQI